MVALGWSKGHCANAFGLCTARIKRRNKRLVSAMLLEGLLLLKTLVAFSMDQQALHLKVFTVLDPESGSFISHRDVL